MKFSQLRLILGSTAVAALLLAGGPAQAQISNSKHNLGSTQVAPNNRSDVVDLCVFCHTPHGSDTGASAPLWNRNLDDTPATTYTTYDQLGTSTLDGTILPVGSVSLACLSCHDGTQALDNVINQPGSGGFDPNGARIPGATWQGPTVDPATGLLIAGVVTNLGTDLQDDHPVGIQYGGFEVGATPTKIDADFKGPGEGLQTATINTNTVWWVDTEATPNGTREKTDIQLYTRANGAAGNQPFVECASCHDPHISGPNNPTFLRISNEGSAVCLACHIK